MATDLAAAYIPFTNTISSGKAFISLAIRVSLTSRIKRKRGGTFEPPASSASNKWEEPSLYHHEEDQNGIKCKPDVVQAVTLVFI